MSAATATPISRPLAGVVPTHQIAAVLLLQAAAGRTAADAAYRAASAAYIRDYPQDYDGPEGSIGYRPATRRAGAVDTRRLEAQLGELRALLADVAKASGVSRALQRRALSALAACEVPRRAATKVRASVTCKPQGGAS